MSHYPVLGAVQRDVRFDGSPPRIYPFGLVVWRALDGELRPLNAELSVDYLGRSVPATIHANDGTSGSLVASAPAFTMADWNRDGVREEQLLQLTDEEALRFYDADSGALAWNTGAKVIRLDWIEQGNADDGSPYWSLTNSAVSGPHLKIVGSGDGKVQFIHDNDTSFVLSQLPVAVGDCCSLRAQYFDDGSVQIGLVRNGAKEVVGTRSAALAPESVWGDGGSVQPRLNELGLTHGAMLLRHFAVYGGTATRRELLEIL
jgi:hypothetical protein